MPANKSSTTDSLKYSLSGFNKNIEIIPNVLTDSWVLNENFKMYGKMLLHKSLI